MILKVLVDLSVCKKWVDKSVGKNGLLIESAVYKK